MGRPSTHRTEDFLDAAVELFTEGGTQAVSMSATAKAIGAPSGSIYHRFADRSTLMAGVWLRAESLFQQGFLAELAVDPPLDAAVAAAGHVVRWCRANPGEGRVLLAGRREFGYPDWPQESVDATRRGERTLQADMRELTRKLDETHGVDRDEVALAVIDLPYAAVRRHLAAGRTPPPRTVDLVTAAARTLLTAGNA